MTKFYDSNELSIFFSENLTKNIEEVERAIILASINKLLFDYEPNTQETLQNYVRWIHNNSRLKVVNTEVDHTILNRNVYLHDVRIESRHGDDLVYNANSELRAKIARGNAILEANDKNGKRYYDLIIFALRKFTGGFGDEDDASNEKRPEWKKYFLRDIKETKTIVSLKKANGEAAHLSCRFIDGEFYLCSGSKNVHMLYKRRSEIEKYYSDAKYQVAREVSYTIVKYLKSLDNDLRNKFLSFLAISRLTVVFEILQPDNQHIEDLSYLSEPLLKFITFTETKLEEKPQSLCYFVPDHALEIGKLFNLSCVESERVQFDKIDDHIREIRSGHGYEGDVLYFIDSNYHVIGLLKKKTVWYIILRAIREKLRSFASRRSSMTLAELEAKIRKRIIEIAIWIGFDEKGEDAWIALSIKFAKWFVNELKTGHIDRSKMISKYPTFWTRFIKDTGLNDDIKMSFKKEEHIRDDVEETLEEIPKTEEVESDLEKDDNLVEPGMKLSKKEKKKLRKQEKRAEKQSKLQSNEENLNTNSDESGPGNDKIENDENQNQETQNTLSYSQKKKLKRVRKLSRKQSQSDELTNDQEPTDEQSFQEELKVDLTKDQENDEFVPVLSKKDQRKLKQQQIMTQLINDENED